MSVARILSLPPDRQGPGAAVSDLEACLAHAARLLGRSLPEAGPRDAVADDDRMGLREALALAERAGLIASFGRLDLRDLDALLCPAILILSGDRAVVVEGLAGPQHLIMHDPALAGADGQDAAETDRATLEKVHTGYALLLRARHHEVPGGAVTGHWFWSAMQDSRWIYVQVVLAAVVANVLGLATSIFTMVVYDRILPNEAVESLLALTLGVGMALVFDFMIKSLRASFIDLAGQRADKAVGRRIFDQVLDIRMQARRGSTGATANTLREFETLREFFTSASLVAVVDLPFISLFVLVIWLIGGPLAIIPAVAVPLVLLIGLAVQPILARLADGAMTDAQTKQAVLVETLTGLETIKAAGLAGRMRDRWDAALERQADHGMKARAVTQFAMNATALTQQAAQVLLIFYGVFLIMEGRLSMGALIAAVILTGRALAPLAQLAQTLTRINQARSSYRALDALMRSDREHPAARQWLSRPHLTGSVTFEDVRLSYDAAPVPVRLAIGHAQPRQIAPADLRRNIGAVLQENWLFSGTLRENIAAGAPRATDAMVLAAARLAGVDDVVARHPQGYDMPIGERGEGLSGGQRQAICVARALIGTPSLLLLDEPTSAMDSASEAALIRRLRDDIGARTLIVITHRPSLLELVDRVIVIENGKVVADGPKTILQHRKPGLAEGRG